MSATPDGDQQYSMHFVYIQITARPIVTGGFVGKLNLSCHRCLATLCSMRTCPLCSNTRMVLIGPLFLQVQLVFKGSQSMKARLVETPASGVWIPGSLGSAGPLPPAPFPLESPYPAPTKA
jgi:cytochrome c551/c552